jgi:ATP-dependent RNA helicase CshB
MQTGLPFTSYALSGPLLAALTTLGYTHTTPVQAATLPRAMQGESLIVRYQTGSGKTHAFLIPIFSALKPHGGLQTIVVSPTRELAMQSFLFAKTLNDALGNPFKIVVLQGGFDKQRDGEKLNAEPDLLFITPGRMVDIDRFIKKDSLAKIKKIVLDEADMLMDPSFIESTLTVLSLLSQPQILVFSASMAAPLLNRLAKYFRPDSIIEPKEKTINPTGVRHALIDIKHQDPIQAIIDFIDITKPYFLLVFASRVQRVVSLATSLLSRNLKVASLHGELQARERRHLLKRIQDGEFQIVIASDIASRGMDLPNVSDVLSVDLPQDLDYYFHRAGRAGRFKNDGQSYVLYNSHEEDSLARLKQRGVHFQLLALKNKQLLPVKHLTRGKIFKKEDEALSRDIKIAIQKYSSHEVKPGYKKKVKLAVEKVRSQYKRKAIKKKIRERLFGG